VPFKFFEPFGEDGTRKNFSCRGLRDLFLRLFLGVCFFFPLKARDF